MRRTIALAATLLLLSPAHAERAEPRKPARTFQSLPDAVDWVNSYRANRDVRAVPRAIAAISRFGGFKEPEAAGVYVGFIAGVIGTHGDLAERLVENMLAVRPEDQWAIVRGIAWSGSPHWRALLTKFAGRMADRQIMIDSYLTGRLARLDQLIIRPSPTTLERIRDAFTIGDTAKPKPVVLEPTQSVLDALWGYYLATGSYGPILKLVDLTIWADDRDEVDKLTIGSMAKYTLSMNATRDAELLSMLRTIRRAKARQEVNTQEARQPALVKTLDEIIGAAETADSSRLRKDALASIEQLRIKGPAYKRELSTWSKVGQGAIAVGCVVAAATGQIEFGIPCVVGGSAASAAMYYMSDK